MDGGPDVPLVVLMLGLDGFNQVNDIFGYSTIARQELSLHFQPKVHLTTVHALRQLGVTLSIDDYGTGYSSLAYLQKLAVHRLKIDRSFVAGMETSQHDRLIVKSTVDLVHQLGLEVIAEGIETRGQYALLQTMGCDVGQGYLIARPMPEEQLMRWYAEGSIALAG